MVRNQNEGLIKKFQKNENDTGSIEVQIVELTSRINQLTGHAKSNPKDFSTKRGLVNLVNRRKKFLEYVKKHSEPMYKEMIRELGLRK